MRIHTSAKFNPARTLVLVLVGVLLVVHDVGAAVGAAAGARRSILIGAGLAGPCGAPGAARAALALGAALLGHAQLHGHRAVAAHPAVCAPRAPARCPGSTRQPSSHACRWALQRALARPGRLEQQTRSAPRAGLSI